MLTRGQVKRALEWERWLAATPAARKKLDVPRCVTCGAKADGTFTRDQPRFDCGPHPPVRLDPETLERARKELGA
jgi:hypothetical protein